MSKARLNLNERELGVLAEALREALAGELLAAESSGPARELLERVDARLPSAVERHPAGGAAGRLIAGDELVRALAAREGRYGHAAMTREELALEFDAKPPGTSVRGLLDDLVREGTLRASGQAPARRYGLTAKGRGRARSLEQVGAPASELGVSEPVELLDLIYADSGGTGHPGPDGEPVGVWHVPTVMAAGRLDLAGLERLEVALRADRLVGERVHSYGTITGAGEDLARERWRAGRPHGGLYGPPRLARPYSRAGEIVVRREDRACPNCGRHASWLARRKGRRYEDLRRRGESDYRCSDCAVNWTVYLEPVDGRGGYNPAGEPAICRPRWRYRSGWLHRDGLAPPDHPPGVLS